MSCCLRRLWNEDTGVIVSAELVLILTIVVLGVLVGLVQFRTAVVAELHDLSLAMVHLDQSYFFTGFRGCEKFWGHTSWTNGSSFVDLYDANNTLSAMDFGGPYVAPGVLIIDGPGYGYGYGYGFGAAASFTTATMVLADGTLIPLTAVASGTWALPGGAILAATGASSNQVMLADGTLVPFVFGAAGTVVFADGRVAAARPGAAGTVVLSDGTIVTLDLASGRSLAADQANDPEGAEGRAAFSGFAFTGRLADGTVVTFFMVDSQSVVLADGRTVVVRAGERSTLVLPDGRVLRLHDAILPPGSVTTPVLPYGSGDGRGYIVPGQPGAPLQPVDPKTWTIPPSPEGTVTPAAPGTGIRHGTDGRIPHGTIYGPGAVGPQGGFVPGAPLPGTRLPGASGFTAEGAVGGVQVLPVPQIYPYSVERFHVPPGALIPVPPGAGTYWQTVPGALPGPQPIPGLNGCQSGCVITPGTSQPTTLPPAPVPNKF